MTFVPAISLAAKNWTPAKAFLFLSLALGLAYTVINPPYAVNDEDRHLARVFELASGRLFTRYDKDGQYHDMPREYVWFANRYVRMRQRDGGRIQVPVLMHELAMPRSGDLVHYKGAAGLYAPLMYLPHIPAVWISTHLNLPCIWDLYLARIAGFVLYSLVAWQAVRIAGPLQWIFIALGLMPMSIIEAAGVDGDSVINALALLFFALLARRALVTRTRPPKAESAAFVGIVVAVTLCKPVYVVLALALPVLCWQGPRARLYRWMLPAVSVVAALLVYSIWMGANPYVENWNSALRGGALSRSPTGQLMWLLEHPWEGIKVAATTLVKYGKDMAMEFVAIRYGLTRSMRYSGGALFVWYTWLLLGLAWGAARQLVETNARRWNAARWMFACWLAGVGAVAFTLYATYTHVGASEIRGLQGRYFIPVAPALLLGLALVGRPTLSRWLTTRHERAVWIAIGCMHGAVLFTMIGWSYFSPDANWPY